MPTSMRAHAGAIAIRPGEAEGAELCPAPCTAATTPPLRLLPPLRPSRYCARPWPARLAALGITVAIHIVIVAVLTFGIRRATKPEAPDDAIVVTLLPLSADKPAERTERGKAAPKARTRIAVAETPPPIMVLPRQPATVALEPPLVAPEEADGGKVDQVAQVTQAYRRAMMTRLEAERRYPRASLLDGYEGIGTVLFHIDRDGRLLDAAITASTGRNGLDRAALALVRRAAPFPAVPPEMPDRLEVSLPIRYLIVAPAQALASR